MSLPSASLYFSDGKSDKVYHARIVARDAGYVVDFQFGRRGSALQSGTKTANPVDLVKATAIFDKLVLEKTGKGYSPDASGVAFQDTTHAGRVTGVLPQLLNPMDEQQLERCLRDDAWWAQHKLDGERRLLKSQGGAVIGINRLGLQVPLPEPLVAAALSLTHDGRPVDFVLDGELIGHKLYVFDLLHLGDSPVTGEPARDRLARLQGLMSSLPAPHGDALALVTTATGEAGKRALLQELRAHEQEGIVFKQADAPYAHGRPSGGGHQLKYKFVESATLQVAGVQDAKRSVALQGFDAVGAAVPLGRVTIPANADIPSPGTIVEVRYLYAYPGGSLFQPVYLGERTDQTVEACSLAQLKYKATHHDGEGVVPAAGSIGAA